MQLNPPIHGEKLPEIRPAWPVVIGVIAAAYASLMLLCNCGGFFAPQIYQWMADLTARSGEHDLAFEIHVEVAWRMQVAYIVFSSVVLLTLILLMTGGIGLAQRRPWARTALRSWAVAELILVLIHIAFEWFSTREAAAIMQQRGMQSEIDALWIELVITVCVLAVLSSVFPTFLLVWLSRKKIRQQVDDWG
jgi:hypothetical protein